MTKAENKIELLKKEIKKLEKEVPTEKRIELIVAKNEERKEQRGVRFTELRKEWDSLDNDLWSNYSDRIIAMLRTARALYDNDFELPKELTENEIGIAITGKYKDCLVTRDEFKNCYWVNCEHAVYKDSEEYYINTEQPYYTDMEYDAEYGVEEYIDFIEISIGLVKRFMNEFDDLEKRFYEYVDNL